MSENERTFKAHTIRQKLPSITVRVDEKGEDHTFMHFVTIYRSSEWQDIASATGPKTVTLLYEGKHPRPSVRLSVMDVAEVELQEHIRKFFHERCNLEGGATYILTQHVYTAIATNRDWLFEDRLLG